MGKKNIIPPEFIKTLTDEIPFLWAEYVMADSDSLGSDALELKLNLMDLADEIDAARGNKNGQ